MEIKIGKALKFHRNKLNLSLTEVAEAIGIHQTHVSSMELDRHSPTLRTVSKYITYFNIEVGAFFRLAETLNK